MDPYIRISVYRTLQTSILKHFILTSIWGPILYFDIKVHWLRYSSLLFHKTSISKWLDFDIEALRYWKYFDIEVNIEVNFDIEAILYRRLLRYRSWNSCTDIEVLYFDIEVSAILKIFDIEDLRSLISKLSLILSGPARAAQGSGKRMQAAAQYWSR